MCRRGGGEETGVWEPEERGRSHEYEGEQKREGN